MTAAQRAEHPPTQWEETGARIAMTLLQGQVYRRRGSPRKTRGNAASQPRVLRRQQRQMQAAGLRSPRREVGICRQSYDRARVHYAPGHARAV